MPRTTPLLEREWLSWMNCASAGMPACGVPLPPVGLDKEATLVAEDRRRDQDGAWDAGGQYLHLET